MAEQTNASTSKKTTTRKRSPQKPKGKRDEQLGQDLADAMNTGGETIGPDTQEPAHSLPPNAQDPGTIEDNPETREEIARGVAELRKMKAERAEINAEMNATRKALYARGLNRESLGRLTRDLEMDQDQRDATEAGYALGRASCDLPVQGALFTPEGTTTH